MGDKAKGLKILMMVAITVTLFIGCGSPPSPIESMNAPIRVVRNDTITQVEDNSGRLYILNAIERSNYGTAFLDLGEELVLKDGT